MLLAEKPTTTELTEKTWIEEILTSLATNDFAVSENNLEKVVEQFNNPIFRDYLIAYATSGEAAEKIWNTHPHEEIEKILNDDAYSQGLTEETKQRCNRVILFINHVLQRKQQVDAYMIAVQAYLAWWIKEYDFARKLATLAREIDPENSLASLMCDVLTHNVLPPHVH